MSTTNSGLSSRESLDGLDDIPIELQRPLVDHATVPTEAQDNAITSASRPLRKQLEHARPQVPSLAGHHEPRTPPTSSQDSVDGPEAIVEISFTFVWPSGATRDTSRFKDPSTTLDASVTLGREIVHSTPTLWTDVSFYLSGSYPHAFIRRKKDVSRVIPALDMWLKNSSALPISLTFTDDRTYDPVTKDLICMLVDRLRNNSRRWKSISLELPGFYFPLLFTFTPCDLASLEHFSINGIVPPINRNVDQPTVTHLNLESATDLKSFAYNGPGDYFDDRISAAWDRLTEFSLAFARTMHVGMSDTLYRNFRQLAQCQNITTCSLGLGLPFDAGQPITLPHLQTLRVRPVTTNLTPGQSWMLLSYPNYKHSKFTL
ncbi:hypothetical protein BU15DRAFT_76362 [Melanogaster broomeanus]|nr:hypothetical protein BU15DRAFT_76362 [Melanogaster broomeanus]